jgi:hypothetical protein
MTCRRDSWPRTHPDLGVPASELGVVSLRGLMPDEMDRLLARPPYGLASTQRESIRALAQGNPLMHMAAADAARTTQAPIDANDVLQRFLDRMLAGRLGSRDLQILCAVALLGPASVADLARDVFPGCDPDDLSERFGALADLGLLHESPWGTVLKPDRLANPSGA